MKLAKLVIKIAAPVFLLHTILPGAYKGKERATNRIIGA